MSGWIFVALVKMYIYVVFTILYNYVEYNYPTNAVGFVQILCHCNHHSFSCPAEWSYHVLRMGIPASPEILNHLQFVRIIINQGTRVVNECSAVRSVPRLSQWRPARDGVDLQQTELCWLKDNSGWEQLHLVGSSGSSSSRSDSVTHLRLWPGAHVSKTDLTYFPSCLDLHLSLTTLGILTNRIIIATTYISLCSASKPRNWSKQPCT